MKVFIALALLVHSVSGAAAKKRSACGGYFRSPTEIKTNHVEIPSSITNLTSDQHVQILRYVRDHGLSVITDEEGEQVAMAFDHRDGQADLGYLLKGSLDGDHFQLASVVVGHKSTGYFKAIARARGLKPMDVSLGRTLVKCQNLKVPTWAQAKIKMKHNLEVDDVIEFLRTSREHPKSQPTKIGDAVKYKLSGQDRLGRHLEIFFARHHHCPNELLTSYEVH